MGIRNKKIELNNLYGELYTYENSASIACGTADTYYDVTGLTKGLYSSNITLNGTAGTITIGNNAGGIYKADLMASIQADKVSVIHMDLFVNDVEKQNIAYSRKIATANQTGSASGSGILDLNDGDIVKAKVSSDINSTNVSLVQMNINLYKVRSGL